MSLPTVTGRGYLLSDGVELKFAKSGIAWARLPLSFRNARKGDDGKWTHDKEVKIEATVFGPLAEHLADSIDGRVDINITGELYTETYEAKDGSTGTALRLQVLSAAPAAVRPRDKVGATGYAAKTESDDAVPF